MVVDLKQAIDISNYFTQLHPHMDNNITDKLLGKYQDIMDNDSEKNSVELLWHIRKQRYDRTLY